METGMDRIKKSLIENCGDNVNLRNFFVDFIEKELYEGHYSDKLKALVDKYSTNSVD